MALPAPLLDLSLVNIEDCVFDQEHIRSRNKQRHEMEMLDKIVYYDKEQSLIAGLKVVRDDEFWIRGHFPDRPIMPGVLVIEASAQLCSFYADESSGLNRVLGFARADNVRFRKQIVPGDKLLITGRMNSGRRNMSRFSAQAYVDNELVFEGDIVGIAI